MGPCKTQRSRVSLHQRKALKQKQDEHRWRNKKPVPAGNKDQKVLSQHPSSRKAGESHPGITTISAYRRYGPKEVKPQAQLNP